MTEHIHPDTVRLLRECDSGVAMGVDALDNILCRTRAEPLKQLLADNKDKHLRLKHEIGTLLERCHDKGKQPPAMAKSMSRIKTGVKMAFDETLSTILCKRIMKHNHISQPSPHRISSFPRIRLQFG